MFDIRIPFAKFAATELTLDERVEKARYVGRAAYGVLDSRIFYMNPAAVELLTGLAVAEGAVEIIDSYTAGWDEAAEDAAQEAMGVSLVLSVTGYPLTEPLIILGRESEGRSGYDISEGRGGYDISEGTAGAILVAWETAPTQEDTIRKIDQDLTSRTFVTALSMEGEINIDFWPTVAPGVYSTINMPFDFEIVPE